MFTSKRPAAVAIASQPQLGLPVTNKRVPVIIVVYDSVRNYFYEILIKKINIIVTKVNG